MSAYIEIHNSTEHDGSIAIEDNDNLTLYSSERINRKKHSNDFLSLNDFFVRQTRGQYKISRKEFEYRPFQPMHHHLAHASCSFFSSPFDRAAILIVDGMGPYQDGNFASTSLWVGTGNHLKLISINPEKDFSYQSLGHLYSSITYYCGFDFWEEGKTMGLAPFGSKSDLDDHLASMVTLLPNGAYKIETDFIGYCFSLKYPNENMFNKYYSDSESYERRYETIFGSRRKLNAEIGMNHKNLAWSVQNCLESTLLHISKYLKIISGQNNLCLGGGVALNSVANGKILTEGIFDSLYIPPICGDDGQALGKLFYNKYVIDNKPRVSYIKSAYLGPIYSDCEIENEVKSNLNVIQYTKLETKELIQTVAKLLSEGKILGWFQGRSEIGPRALGHRSIIADPRKKEMKDIINARIKHREPFRPFAPSILNECLHDYFYSATASPFMLRVFKAKPKAVNSMPAVVHVDGTSRVQTVTPEDNDVYHSLIKEFYALTGVPAILNTSFNDNGEPIVETAHDTIRCFLHLDLDALVLVNYLIFKKPQ